MQIYLKISLVLTLLFACFSFQEVRAIYVPVTTDLSPLGLNCSRMSKNSQGGYSVCGVAQGGSCRLVCNVGVGFKAVEGIFQGLIKYIAFIASLGAVLFIVINGILYSMAGLDEQLKSQAKHKIFMMLGGIMLLLLSGVVLNVIAPWVYK